MNEWKHKNTIRRQKYGPCHTQNVAVCPRCHRSYDDRPGGHLSDWHERSSTIVRVHPWQIHILCVLGPGISLSSRSDFRSWTESVQERFRGVFSYRRLVVTYSGSTQ